jgi:hypothetical protein
MKHDRSSTLAACPSQSLVNASCQRETPHASSACRSRIPVVFIPEASFQDLTGLASCGLGDPIVWLQAANPTSLETRIL